LLTAALPCPDTGAIAALAIAALAHAPVSLPAVEFVDRLGTDRPAILSREKRRFAGFASGYGFVNGRIAKSLAQLGNKLGNLGHRMSRSKHIGQIFLWLAKRAQFTASISALH
jgi:hypothetical protein